MLNVDVGRDSILSLYIRTFLDLFQRIVGDKNSNDSTTKRRFGIYLCSQQYPFLLRGSVNIHDELSILL